MVDARTRFVRIRSRAAGLFAAGYVVALTSFWVAGAAAYSHSVHGLSRLLGLAYFPILLLPVVGRGTLEGLKVHGTIWLWWFGLQMILGVAAIWLYPYERPRQAARVAGALDWLESTSPGARGTEYVVGLGSSASARAGLREDKAAAALLAEIEATPGARKNWRYAIYLPTMVRTALGIGDQELAERLADGVEPRYPYAEHALVAANAALAEARGDPQAAADAYGEAADGWERFGVVPEQAFALLGQGRCLVGLARPTEAVHVLDQAREIFDELGAAPALAETDALLQEAIALSS